MKSSSIGNKSIYMRPNIRPLVKGATIRKLLECILSSEKGLITRKVLEQREQALLSPQAAHSILSRDRNVWLNQAKGVHNRLVSNTPVHTRFSADREQILDSEAFRKLSGKTQVLIQPKDATITTRLFHTIQVAELAKTVGRALGLNEDLIEAIAFGHDLGHTPFGHAGERALRKFYHRYVLPPLCIRGCQKRFKFSHNKQSLWITDALYPWMNLSFEVRDGILRHSGAIGMLTKPSEFDNNDPLVNRLLFDCSDLAKVNSEKNPTTLEGCLIKVMDKVASVAQDLIDLQKAGLIDPKHNNAHNYFLGHIQSLTRLDYSFFVKHPHALHEFFVEDLIKNSRGKEAISFSSTGFEAYNTIRQFVDKTIRGGEIELKFKDKIYKINQSPIIRYEDEKAIQTVTILFKHLFINFWNNGHDDFADISPYYIYPGFRYPWRFPPNQKKEVERKVALKVIDEITNMTDRQAIEMLGKIIHPGAQF